MPGRFKPDAVCLAAVNGAEGGVRALPRSPDRAPSQAVPCVVACAGSFRGGGHLQAAPTVSSAFLAVRPFGGPHVDWLGVAEVVVEEVLVVRVAGPSRYVCRCAMV